MKENWGLCTKLFLYL